MKNEYKWVFVLLCAIIATVCGQFSLFIMTLPAIRDLSLLIKMVISICFTLVQLLFMVYYIKVGIQLMNTVSLVIIVFTITFILQLITNYYIYGNKNTLDDYVSMIIMTIGIIITQMQLFN